MYIETVQMLMRAGLEASPELEAALLLVLSKLLRKIMDVLRSVYGELFFFKKV